MPGPKANEGKGVVFAFADISQRYQELKAVP